MSKAGTAVGAGLLLVAAALASGVPPAAAAAPQVHLSARSLYDIPVPPGTWVPVAVSVTSSGSSAFRGYVDLGTSAVFPADAGCLANGPTTYTCLAGQAFADAPASGAGPGGSLEIPVVVAPGTTKSFVEYVWAAQPGAVGVQVVPAPPGPGGPGASMAGAAMRRSVARPVARATVHLRLATGTASPEVLVVTSGAVGAAMAGVGPPTGGGVQLQYLSPSQLPAAPFPLGVFRAIAIDQVGAGVLSPAQAQALQAYVRTGGSLVVFGGQATEGNLSGLPGGLLVARPRGVTWRTALPGLGGLLGAPSLPREVDLARLVASPGSIPILATRAPGAGPSPNVLLAVEAPRGAGHVVVCAFDPASAPLSNWAGLPKLLQAVFATAFGAGYFSSALPYGEAGGPFPVQVPAMPVPAERGQGAAWSSPGPFLSLAVAAEDVAGYLRQTPAPAEPPSPGALGLALVLYVVLVGPLCFLVVRRWRRSPWGWAVVPALALTSAGVAVLTWGEHRHAQLAEASVLQIAPASHRAEVFSVGALKLPDGGTHEVEMSVPGGGGPALVGLLGVPGARGTRTALLQGAPGPEQDMLLAAGGRGTLAQWVASEEVHVLGVVDGYASPSALGLSGRLVNRLPTRLTHCQVVAASGEASEKLGPMPPGGSTIFSLAVPSSATPATAAFEGPNPAPGASALGGGALPPLPREPLGGLLGDLADAYSASLGGRPVFIGLSSGSLAQRDMTSSVRSSSPVDVVVMGLPVAALPDQPVSALPGELVSASGVRGDATYAFTTASLALAKGGYFGYRFSLPEGRWKWLTLDLGSSLGSWRGPVVGARAYDYVSGTWRALALHTSNGALEASFAHPDRYIAGGVVEVRLWAKTDGVAVYGAFPTLWGLPAP